MIDMLSFFTDEMISATLYQYGNGSLDAEGRWVAGSETSSTIQLIAPQPVKADEIVMMEPGEQITDYVKTWLYDAITLNTREGAVDADQIVVGGERYRVHQINHWESAGQFVSAVLRRLQ